MKLKVAWRKVKKRVVLLLKNIFRLHKWWAICHPGKSMRWLSLDQKPSWFNNVGHTGTFAKKGGSKASVIKHFAHTRQMYTILFSVPYGWRMIDHLDGAPKAAMLFTGILNRRIVEELEASKHVKP